MDAMAQRSHPSAAAATTDFPVGWYEWHPDASLNFQLNRWYAWVGEARMLQEMRELAPRLRDYDAWTREFMALGDRAAREGRLLPAAYHWRCAEFFMAPDDPRRPQARERFVATLRACHDVRDDEVLRIPFPVAGPQACLPAYRLRPAHGEARCSIVFFGGFDSYIEELLPAGRWLCRRGFEVVLFDGPGQGGMLEEQRVPMTADWQRPVAAVLDHLGLQRAALIGLSLGGCLAMRAAAFEPRVQWVVAWDILSDFLTVNLRQLAPWQRVVLRWLLRAGATSLVDRLVARAARGTPLRQWGLQQGMHVTGTRSPAALLQALAALRTDDVSARVHQDVLLLAGAEDHYVPLSQLHDQRAWLTQARSVSQRVFTREECAQSHCQAGNYGLALRTIADWLDERLANAQPAVGA